MHSFAFRFMMPVAKILARIFHRRLEVHGLEHVPKAGPLLLAANHPNMMLDVLLLSSTQPRILSFLAKATLFQNPMLKPILGAFGVLPVYRKRDNPADMSQNLLTFAACYERLENNGTIALFPEGVSHDRNRVLPLKTGCARIALEAEAKNNFKLGVRIVPVGISFSHRELFRSDALVSYGAPLDVSTYRASYETDAAETVRRLTSALGEALRQRTHHIPQEEDEELVLSLREFFGPEEKATRERLEIDRVLVDATQYFKRRDPLRYQRLRRRLTNYARLLTNLGLSEYHLERDYRFASVARYLLPRLALAVVGAPIALFGAVVNFLPYRSPRWLAGALATDPVEIASIKFFGGLVSFPVYYGGVAVLIVWKFGVGSAALGILSGVATGLIALFYSEALTGFPTEIYAFAVRKLSAKKLAPLHRMRNSLLEELAQCRDEYLFAREDISV